VAVEAEGVLRPARKHWARQLEQEDDRVALRVAVVGGTGHEGFGMALRWAACGYEVVIGSRDAGRAEAAAERARQLLDGRGQVRGASNGDAAAWAEVVVLTIPFEGHEAMVPVLAPHVGGKVVVDTTVPLARFRPPVLHSLPEGSCAQRLQAQLAEARVVAGFHTVSAALLAELARPLDQDTLVCGEDAGAKSVVAEMARAIGLRPVDAGGLAQAATLERLAALVIGLNQRYRRNSIGVRFTGL